MAFDYYAEDRARHPRPFRCQSCCRVGMTVLPRPRCSGVDGDPHEAAAMKRVPGAFADRAVELHIA